MAIMSAARTVPILIMSCNFSNEAELTSTCPALQPVSVGVAAGSAVGVRVAVGVGVGVGADVGVAVGVGVGVEVAVGTGVEEAVG